MGAYLNAPKTEKRTLTGENSWVEFASSEMQGWRMTMEDAKISSIEEEEACFGVFDGHGGSEVAIFVQKHFLSALKSSPSYKSSQFERSLEDTFLKMDELLLEPTGQKEIIRIQQNLPEDYAVTATQADSMAGCTSVVALVKNNSIYVANAGDSRCVIGKAGKAVEMSIDHKPELPEELNRIHAAGGTVEDGRVMGNINLSRSIGDFEYKKSTGIPPQRQMVTAFPDLRVAPLDETTDVMILACDGIWDMINNQDCIDFIYRGLSDNKSLSEITEALMEKCLAPDITTYGGLGCDNMTCTIVRFKH